MPGRKPWIRRGACAAIAAAAIAFTPGVAGAVVFPVTSTADSGPGTLRQAITDANTTTDPDYIHFDLPPSAPTIVLGATPLPPITQPLFIDGRSQPVTHRVELNGENVADSGLFVRATFSAVVGLDIHSFFGAGIEISNGAGAVTIADNYIGTNFDGTVAKPNHTGVLVAASAGANNVIGGPIARDRNVISGNSENGVVIDATRQIVVGNYIGVESGGSRDLGNTSDGILVRSTASHVQIGGDTPEERNVISGNGYLGIETLGPTNVVQGNYIGTDSTGAVAVPNEVAGVALESADNVVGGADPGVGNLISGNANYGIALNSAGSTRNHVTGNLIGTKADGRRALGNASGIYFTAGAGANGNVIGEPPAGANVIAYNTDTGIVAIGGTGNAFRANSIYGNGRLGIDLGAAGVDPNDAGDGDSGANDLQNFPVIDSVENAAGGTRIRGHLDTSSSGMYFVDLYSNDACDASGNGEGQHWLGQAFVTPDFAGHATFDVTLATSTVHFSAPAYHVGEGGGMAIVTVERQNLGRFITSTATSTTGNTSEFGPCVEGPGTSSVQYATSADGATPGADYTESSGPLDFGATETSKTFSVPIANDSQVEGAERVTLTLSASAGAALGTPDHATLTIDDDDVPVTTPPPPPPDTAPPAITAARIGQRFRIGSLQPLLLRPVAAPTGTIISFTLSEPARATFAFKRKTAGRRVRGRCVRPTRNNRRAPRCTRRIAAGSFSLEAHMGANRVRFQGRIGTRRLTPGRYALELSAVDAAGNRSRVVPLSFTLLSARRSR